MRGTEELTAREREAFLAYANRYDRTNTMIELKVVHTLLVVSVMDEITGELDLSERDRYLAGVCAMFHDIGRFEQIVRYGTFNDSKSIDHAALSCEILEEERMLAYLPEADAAMVLAAIANHNRLAIDADLEGETLRLAKLIRDADKCDIFRVFAEENMVDTMGETVAEVEQECVSDEVYARIMRHECVPRSIRVSGLDFWIGFLGFFYDMNYDASVRLALREGYYRMPFDRAEFADPETRKRVASILEDLEKTVRERLGSTGE